MRTSIRARPVILVAVLVAALVPAGPGLAAGNAGADDLRVTPVGSPRFSVSVDPGASAQRSFVVANRSRELRLTVRLSTVDAAAAAGGAVHYAKEASSGGPAKWLTLSDVVATLEPGATVRVSMKVAPPANAEPGDVLAGVVARVDHAVRADDGSPSTLDRSVSLPVAIKVKGAPTALVSIVDVRAVKSGSEKVLEITFLNSGATRNTMVGRAHLLDEHGQSVPVRASVAPLTHTTVRVPLQMPSGNKTARVAVTVEAAGGDQAAWSGKVQLAAAPSAPVRRADAPANAPRLPATPAHKSSVPSPAIVLVGLGFLAAAVWFAAELKRSRKSRRAVVRVAPVAAPATASARVAVANSARGADVMVGGTDQMGAIAAQLGALVEAIDRLAGRLGAAAPVATPPAPAPAAAARASEHVVASPPEALLYAPAASPHATEEPYPYDWPTQAQLDEFAARRREAQTDT